MIEVVTPDGAIRRPILAAGESAEGLEVISINPRAGKVLIRLGGAERELGFSGIAQGGGPALRLVELNLENADLDAVFDQYGATANRTVLQYPALPKVTITLKTETPIPAEDALRLLDSALATNRVSTKLLGERFVVAATTDRLDTLPALPDKSGLPATGSVRTVAPSAVRMKNLPLDQFLAILAELTGRTPLGLPFVGGGPSFTFRNQSSLTVTEMVHAMELLALMRDATLVAHGHKFLVVVPRALAAELPRRLPPQRQVPQADEIVARADDLRLLRAPLTQLLDLYAGWLGRTALPADPRIANFQFNFVNHFPLTRGEAVHAFDTLLALQRMKFVTVDDQHVKVVFEPAERAGIKNKPAKK